MSTTKTPSRRGKNARPAEGTQSAPRSAKNVTGVRKLGARRSSMRKSTERVAAQVETVIFEASSGNVFADIGARDAEERLAKAELARIVRSLVRERQTAEGWTQARAARVLGIKAPDMSNLLRGKLAGFSQERLEHFLTRLDMDVRIQVAPRVAGKRPAAITVERVAAFA